ncbi:MAG: murein hydrolase activator EnvC family protein [Bacteroidota bacterium]
MINLSMRFSPINGFLSRAAAVLMLVAFLLPSNAWAQSRKELEKKKNQLRKDIEQTNKMLKQTRKDKSSSLNQLVTLNKKITYRSELIQTINTEINTVDRQIGTVENRIDSLQSRLEALKKRYAETLVVAYKNLGSMNTISFVLASDDMNQAFKRMRYIRQLADHRVRQQRLIVATQDSLSGRKRELKVVRTDKTHLLVVKEKEKKELDNEKRQQVSMLNNLSAKEKQLRAELKRKQQQEQQLSARIEAIIRKEIAAAQASAKNRASKSVSASTSTKTTTKAEKSSTPYVLANTPDAIKLSNDFEGNKGRLPWPVEQGVITGSFGRHAHPVWHDVVVNNNGVNIATTKGAKARAIFDGKVVRVLMVVDKYAVLVQHGEYFTLYSNLESVSVQAGERVSTKQVLGTITEGDQEGKGEVHLEIWRGSNKMNPQSWLASR